MLGKLLKYEIKHSARYTAAIYLATLAFAAVSVISSISLGDTKSGEVLPI